MRTFLLFNFILCFSYLNAENNFLIVFQKDGTQTGFALAEKPVIDCSLGQLSVTSAKYSMSIPLADVEKYSFVDDLPSNIPIFKYEEGNIKVKSGHVTIESMPSNTIVSVFGINGTTLKSYITDSNGHLEFDLPNNSKAVIIKANSTSVKVIKK